MQNRISQKRAALGLTQGTLARQVGVDRVTVWRWETGQMVPHPLMQRRLATVLESSPHELFPWIYESCAHDPHDADALTIVQHLRPMDPPS